MNIKLWLPLLAIPLAASCSGPVASVRESGVALVRHRPAGSAELLAGAVAAAGQDVRQGEWWGKIARREGNAVLVTVSRAVGTEANAPREEYDLLVRDGWIESVSDPRYVAPSHDLEDAVALVARQAAAAADGFATLTLPTAVLSGRRTEQRCLVEVRARSPERRELFSRLENVCP
ncbi:hypothetical protein GURASL_30440 [Geotalea uraniireducens]|uniref:Uncharacterized protein n=1 Tax=Geotalea uraniireducens TaxID=351604 RepID=A0ABM8ENU4_9BACT|nr:hypothetical protein [Geotalea uraniireducens]BDV44121.1 hypothetical protein GURASL_30440 [Geotalea uraniireducens]